MLSILLELNLIECLLSSQDSGVNAWDWGIDVQISTQQLDRTDEGRTTLLSSNSKSQGVKTGRNILQADLP